MADNEWSVSFVLAVTDGGPVDDPDVLGELVRHRWRALVGYGHVLCGEVTEAEELVSEAVLRTFARRRVRETGAAESYVRSTMLRLYIDGWRRQRRWFGLRARVVQPDRVEPVDLADRLTVREALASLPRRERACVVLRYWDDFTVPRIAAELDLAEGTVKRYLNQAMARLGDSLRPDDDAAVVSPTSKREQLS